MPCTRPPDVDLLKLRSHFLSQLGQRYVWMFKLPMYSAGQIFSAPTLARGFVEKCEEANIRLPGGLLNFGRSGDRTTRRAALGPRPVTVHSHPPAWMSHDRCTRPHFHPVSLQAHRCSWHETRTPTHGNAAEARGCTGYASRIVFRLSPRPEAGRKSKWRAALASSQMLLPLRKEQ